MGVVTLEWDTARATAVEITPDVGAVGTQGSQTRTVTQSTTFELTARDADGDSVSCTAPVAVADPALISCEDNVVFTASDTTIDEGQSTILTWSTTDIDTQGRYQPGLPVTLETSNIQNIHR